MRIQHLSFLIVVASGGIGRGQEIPKISDDIRKQCEKRSEKIVFYAPNPWGELANAGENPKAQKGLFPIIHGSAVSLPPGTPDLGMPFGFRLSLAGAKFESRMVSDLKNLRYLDLSDHRYDLDDFKKLAKHPALAMLSMEAASDEILEVLKDFDGIEHLEFRISRNLTLRGLTCLTQMKKLKWLKISSGYWTDEEYKELATIKTLTHLDISSGSATDVSIKILKELPDLEELNISGNGKVTPACFKELKGMKNLRALELPSFINLDPGLRELKELKNFKALKVTNSVGAYTIAFLSEFKQLEHLTIMFHDLKEEDLQKLKKALPNTKIEH